MLNAAVPLAVGALSALWLVFAFSQPKPITKVLFTTLLLQRSGRLPVWTPDRPFPQNIGLLAAMAQKAKKEPEPASPALSWNGDHELLQAGLIDYLAFRHFGAWRLQVIRAGS